MFAPPPAGEGRDVGLRAFDGLEHAASCGRGRDEQGLEPGLIPYAASCRARRALGVGRRDLIPYAASCGRGRGPSPRRAAYRMSAVPAASPGTAGTPQADRVSAGMRPRPNGAAFLEGSRVSGLRRAGPAMGSGAPRYGQPCAGRSPFFARSPSGFRKKAPPEGNAPRGGVLPAGQAVHRKRSPQKGFRTVPEPVGFCGYRGQAPSSPQASADAAAGSVAPPPSAAASRAATVS